MELACPPICTLAETGAVSRMRSDVTSMISAETAVMSCSVPTMRCLLLRPPAQPPCFVQMGVALSAPLSAVIMCSSVWTAAMSSTAGLVSEDVLSLSYVNRCS